MNKPNQSTKISITIPTLWTKPLLIEQCLQSLEKLIVPHNVRIQIVIVSNTSQKDMSENLAKIHVPESLPLMWIAQGRNTGFAAATNAGFKAISADFYLCLNDDTQVDPNWLIELLAAQKKSGADMVASRIFLADGKSLDSEGFTFAWRGKAEALRNRKSSLNDFEDHWLKNQDLLPLSRADYWQEPFGPDAAACLYTHKLIDTVGMFDESFFAYLEDVDLALRARLTGMKCVLAEKAVVYHHKHATSSTMSSFKAKQDFKNWWRIMVKYPEKVWEVWWWQILVERARNLSGYCKQLVGR